MTRPPIWASRKFCRRCRSARVSGSTKMKPRRSATGTFRKRTNSNRGAMRAHMTARLSVIQPLIAPLYGGKSEVDFLAVLNGQAAKPSHDIVHDYWQAQRPNVARFDAFWEKTLRDGVVADTAFPPKQVSLKPGIGAERSGRRCAGPRNCFSSRSHHLGRPLCKQRLAAGIAQAADQAHLGLRGHAQPENSRAPGSRRAKMRSN